MTKTEKGWEIGTKIGEIGLAYFCFYQFADYLCFCSLLTIYVLQFADYLCFISLLTIYFFYQFADYLCFCSLLIIYVFAVC